MKIQIKLYKLHIFPSLIQRLCLMSLKKFKKMRQSLIYRTLYEIENIRLMQL